MKVRRREPKSDWCRVGVDTPRCQEAARSWFPYMAGPEDVVVKANLLSRIADDKPVKLRALIRRAGGEERELVRTFGQRFTVTSKRPTAQEWV